MDFSEIDSARDLKAFRERVDRFTRTHVTDALLAEERSGGSGFNLALHLAMAAEGWILPELSVDQGGAALGAVERRILDVLLQRAGAPLTTLNTTRHLLPGIQRFGEPAFVRRIVRGVADGSIRLCMGLTESESGSDVAAASTRAVADGDGYRITGTKPYVTGAHNAQYCFLVTRTSSTLGKHRGISIFLVPLDAPGVEILPVRWLSGERANAVHFEGVRVSLEHRLGAETEGWRVLTGVLDVEHGMQEARGGLEDRSFAETHLRIVERALDTLLRRACLTRDAEGRLLMDDPRLRLKFAEMTLDIEAARCAPAALGRVYGTEITIRVARKLVDLTCPAGPLWDASRGSCDNDAFALLCAWSQGMSVAGGTIEVVRTIIAERNLGLPRPAYGARSPGGDAKAESRFPLPLETTTKG